MSLGPGYGETPVSEDDLAALTPAARGRLNQPPTKADVYDLEQALQDDVADDLALDVVEGTLTLDDLLSDHTIRDVHRRLYEPIWTWAGVSRRREMNIGVAPDQISVTLRTSLDAIRHRWLHTDDWTPHQLGIAVHAETVRIHPFTDGNGRATRLLADLVFLAAQETGPLRLYDWNVDKGRYIDLLQEYDRHRDPRSLAAFIGTQGDIGV